MLEIQKISNSYTTGDFTQTALDNFSLKFRTKEIGILRVLGARRKDIKHVFNAETFIIGIFSGILGIVIARILIIPTNINIENASELPNVAKLSPIHAIILIVISVTLTIIGGLIPASMASKKDPVEALRTE